MPSSTSPLLLNRIRMRQVLLMLSIHEHRTLHAAAQQLGMTQSAASKMLHELEAAVGETLFDREGRGLRLNPAGLAVMNSCRSLRSTMTALGHELSKLRQGSAEKIYIGSIMVALPDCLSVALLETKRIYPLLSVEVVIDTSDRLIELLRDEFARMRGEALFINCGRGVAVVEADLVAALRSGLLAGAVIDVCREEPLPPGHPFWDAPRLLLTGHSSAPTEPAALVALFLDNLQRYRDGQPLRGEVDFVRGY